MSPLARRAVAAAVVVLGLAAIAAVAWLLWADRALDRTHAGWEGAEVIVDLERGLTGAGMIARLERHGVLAHPRLTALWLRWTGDAAALHAGEYRFDAPVSAREVVRRLRAGEVWLHPLTFPEGLSLHEVADRIAEAGFGDVDTARAAVDDPGPVAGVDPSATDLEGYLFPETYRFARGTPPVDVVRAMVARFAEVTGEDYAERARAVGLTVREAVTLASMIEKETSVPDERGRISRVFHNRLDRRMKMQCDPTVLYALRREGVEVGRLLRKHLEFESPYNTYRVRGLPPGPICSPGAASLEAAVAPDPGEDLYFVAKPGGGHAFTRTLDAHLRAVREWRAYARSSR